MELEILEYNESGYKPLVSYNGWRVAVANCAQKWVDGQLTYMERHLLTDEVFVLLLGEVAFLLLLAFIIGIKVWRCNIKKALAQK